MNRLLILPLAALAVACNSKTDTTEVETPIPKTVLDLSEIRTNPAAFEWFDFRPNVKKLILSGTAETEHIAILWYTVADGSVGLHFHSKTESVYVIDGTQTDAKGVYPTGTLYFNPPGSGHAIMNSSGFFVLAYAAPPDFTNTDLIEQYTPVRIDTANPELTSALSFEERAPGVRTFEVPLHATGGMRGEFISVTSPGSAHDFTGNYLLVIEGSCNTGGARLGKEMLVVAGTVAPQPFEVSAAPGESCLALGVSFQSPAPD